MVVVNITNEDLKIPEIRSIVPADGKNYIIPYEIAIRYKHALKPIQMSDDPSPIEEDSSPIDKQIMDMNQNAVMHLQELEKELTNINPIIDPVIETPTVSPANTAVSDSDREAWLSKSKYDRIIEIWSNNPDWTAVKISEYAETSYVYAQKTILKIKKNGIKQNA